MKKMKKSKCSNVLLLGIFLISVLFFLLFVSSIMFMFKVPINSFNMVFALVFSTAVTFYFSDKSIKRTAVTVIAGLIIIAASVVICMHIYDWSWDGNAYRKARPGLMKYGWNPIYESYSDFASSNVPDVFIKPQYAWYDTAPKASEIIGANFYQITNNIEAGKCYTMIAALALLCICYAFLYQTELMKKWQCGCCAACAVLNPLTVAQATTYYNDAFLNMMLLLCLVALIYLTFYEKDDYDRISWYFVFVSINIGFNIKLSMPLFLAIICLTFFIYWVFTYANNNGIHNTVLYYRKHFCIFAASVLSGIFITGVTYYVSNFMRYGSPFGTSSAGGAANEITNQVPTVFKEMSNLKRFVCSLFSRTNTSLTIETVQWKIPLTFNGGEFSSAQNFACRTAGWGIFFSGIFLISIGVILYGLFKMKGRHSELKRITVILLLVWFLSICLVPGLSWSKYHQVIFWIPVMALIFIFLNWNYDKNRSLGMVFTSGVLVILLCLNMVPNFAKCHQLIKDYKPTLEQLEQFKSITEDSQNDVIVDIVGTGDFVGRFFNLYDMGITNFSRGDVDTDSSDGILFLKGYWGRLAYKIKPAGLERPTEGIDNTEEFLDFLENNIEDYTILIAAMKDSTKSLTDEVTEDMRDLGLEFNLPGHYRWSYLAVVDSGEILYEDLADEKIEYETNIDGKVFSLTSMGHLEGGVASIKIDGAEYALNKRGLNIVIYDKEQGAVADSVHIDSFEDNSLSR